MCEGRRSELLVGGCRYDVAHNASFPYCSVVVTAAARPLQRFHFITEWHEMRTWPYWRDQLGASDGRWEVQRLYGRVFDGVSSFRLHTRRLIARGPRGTVTILERELRAAA